MQQDASAARWSDEAPPDAPPRRPRRRAGAWLAALPLLAVSAVLGCRAADTDAVTPVPQLLAFLPWLIVPTVVALLLALLARWRLGLVWGVVVLGGLAWFVEPYGRVADAHGTPVAELRVLTSNVEFGRATAALITTVRAERPDIVFVQECGSSCVGALERALGRDTYAYRATDGVTGVPRFGYGNGGRTPAGTDGDAAEPAGLPASHGSLILSRLPLAPAPRVPGTLGMPGALAVVRGHPVRLQLAHPMPPRPRTLGTWRSELGALRDYAAAGRGRSTMLAGDFNASQDHAAFRRILDAGLRDGARLAGSVRAPSWPSGSTPTFGVQIDHVLLSPDFSVRAARFAHLDGTDHRALLTELTLRDQDPSPGTSRGRADPNGTA